MGVPNLKKRKLKRKWQPSSHGWKRSIKIYDNLKRFQLFSNLFLTYFASGCNHKSVFWELVTCLECQDRGWLAILDTYIDLLWGCPQSRQDVGESIFTSLHPCPLGHTLVWPLVPSGVSCGLPWILKPESLSGLLSAALSCWLGHIDTKDSIICWLLVCTVSFSPKLWPWPHWDQQLLTHFRLNRNTGVKLPQLPDKWMQCAFPLYCYENQCPAYVLILATLEATKTLYKDKLKSIIETNIEKYFETFCNVKLSWDLSPALCSLIKRVSM